MADPVSAARVFLSEDPDPETRGELQRLLERAEGGDHEARLELADRFRGPLEFGTAGLRGRVEAGLARMNRVVVAKAAWGLGTYLLENRVKDPRRQGVVVGFDGRRWSRQFAEDTAAVLAGLAIPVHILPEPAATPLVAFAVPHLRASAGVVVTASHNPPSDNGYKVYLASGAQIVPPVDSAIARCIARAPSLETIPRAEPPEAAERGLRRLVDGSDHALENAYLDGLARGALHPPETTPLRIAYTALHGVGHRLLLRALARSGFTGLAAVPSQSDPDGAFPTVRAPNPEEPGAMERVLDLAARTGAELVLANDPDADRLAAAVPDPDGRGYRMLTGNEIGFLLADDALDNAETGGRRPLVVTTLVSSTLLSRMARDRGAAYRETLTGFKWIMDAAFRGEASGEAFVCGYEEALGYAVGSLVRDKDGIGAALRLAELARHLKGRGRTLLDRIDELLVTHGLSHSLQWSATLPGPQGRERIRTAMSALRSRPLDRLDSSPVVRVRDAATGEETTGGTRHANELPRSDLLAFHSAEGARLTVRPSGTEPKVKFYLELVGHADRPADVAPERARLEARGRAVKEALLEHLGLTDCPT